MADTDDLDDWLFGPKPSPTGPPGPPPVRVAPTPTPTSAPSASPRSPYAAPQGAVRPASEDDTGPKVMPAPVPPVDPLGRVKVPAMMPIGQALSGLASLPGVPLRALASKVSALEGADQGGTLQGELETNFGIPTAEKPYLKFGEALTEGVGLSKGGDSRAFDNGMLGIPGLQEPEIVKETRHTILRGLLHLGGSLLEDPTAIPGMVAGGARLAPEAVKVAELSNLIQQGVGAAALPGMASGAVESFGKAKEAFDAGDYQGALQHALEGAGYTGMGALAAHGMREHAPAEPKAGPKAGPPAAPEISSPEAAQAPAAPVSGPLAGPPAAAPPLDLRHLAGGPAGVEAQGGSAGQAGRAASRALAPDLVPSEASLAEPRPEMLTTEQLHGVVDHSQDLLARGESLDPDSVAALKNALAELNRRGEGDLAATAEIDGGQAREKASQIGWDTGRISDASPADVHAALEDVGLRVRGGEPPAGPPAFGEEIGAAGPTETPEAADFFEGLRSEMRGEEPAAPAGPPAAPEAPLTPEELQLAADHARELAAEGAPEFKRVEDLAGYLRDRGVANADRVAQRVSDNVDALQNGSSYHNKMYAEIQPPADLTSRTPAFERDGVRQWVARFDEHGQELAPDAPAQPSSHPDFPAGHRERLVSWAQDPVTGELRPAGGITNLRGERHYLVHNRRLVGEAASHLPTSFEPLVHRAEGLGWREAPDTTSSSLAQDSYARRMERARAAAEAAQAPALEEGGHLDAEAPRGGDGGPGDGERAEAPRAGEPGGGEAGVPAGRVLPELRPAEEGGGQAAGPPGPPERAGAGAEAPGDAAAAAGGGGHAPEEAGAAGAAVPPDAQAGGEGAPPEGVEPIAGGPSGGADSPFILPEHTFPDKVASWLQDQLRRVEKVEGALKSQGATDRQLMKKLGGVRAKASAGQARIMSEFMEPLLHKLNKAGAELSDLDDYLMLRHKPTRDAAGQLRGADPARGPASGISDAEAAAMRQRLEQKYGPMGGEDGKTIPALEPAAKTVRSLLDHNLKSAREGGLLSQTQVDALKSFWGEDYVPLRSEEADAGAESHPGVGASGYSVRGKEYKAATGRRTQADSPTAYAFKQTLRTVERAERNKAGAELAKWLVENKLVELDPQHATQTIDPKTGEVMRVADQGALRGDFSYKEDGVTHRIDLKGLDPALDEAVQNMGARELQGAMSAMAKLTRRFSALATSYTPSFLLTNPLRDIHEAMINAGVEHGAGTSAAVLKNWRSSAADIWAHQRNPTSMDPRVQRVREFYEDGGAVGWSQQQTATELEKSMQAYLESHGPGKVKAMKRGLRAVAETVEHANKTLENATRFSVYKTLTDKGVPRLDAGHYARNVTLDFTKHGKAGPLLSSLYAFFNANMQGAKRLKEVAWDSPKGRKVSLGIAAAGALLDHYNRMAASDANDDGINDYDQIPQYIKEKNFVFVRPEWMGGGPGKAVLTFPLPYGFGMIYSLGRKSTEVAEGATSPQKAAFDTAMNLASGFNPLGGGANFGQVIAPTLARPFVEHATNTDWTGRKIVPEPSPYKHPVPPPSEQKYKNAPPLAVDAARALNSATGGDDLTPGAVSISPEVINHYVTAANSYLTGGLGKEGMELVQALRTVAGGEAPKLRNIPVAKRFAYSPGDTQETSSARDYHDNMQQLQDAAARFKTYAKRGEMQKARQIPVEQVQAFIEIQQIDKMIQLYHKAQASTGRDFSQEIMQLENHANRIANQALRGDKKDMVTVPGMGGPPAAPGPPGPPELELPSQSE